MRYESRRRNYLLFAERVRASPGVRLLTIECAFGDGPFELDAAEASIQVRAEKPLWIKENLLNLGWARVDTPYIAWIDNDVIFQDPAWGEQTVAALRDYALIQPWSSVHFLDPDGQDLGNGVGAFCKVHQHGYVPFCRGRCCHTGFAWAARREVLEKTEGLLEELIVGGADHLMAAALFGHDRALWMRWTGADAGAYPERLEAWCRTFRAAVGQDIAYLRGDIHHLFHGKLGNRKYVTRHAITTAHGFDAAVHLRKNADGVNQIVGLPGLCDDLQDYFQGRQEDAPQISEA
jgi:hypothetical protein